MKKITVLEARNLLANAKNNGERMEALTILELHCTQYNPYLSASKGGDVYAPKYGNIQVKAFDGSITVPNGTTGNILKDLETCFTHDASQYWMIWFTDDQYILMDKWELLKRISNKLITEEVIRYNVRNSKEVIRFKLGKEKRKYFFNDLIERKRVI